MNFDQRKATDNWATVDWNREVWIPVPFAFKNLKWADAAEWALDYAGDRFLRGGREVNRGVMKKEVGPFAQGLVQGRSELVGKTAAHKIYYHCPDYTKTPVAAAIGLWKCQGTREEAFQFYSYWGAKTATSTPEAEWIETESLGMGVRAKWTGVTGPGRYWQVNYIFRDEEFDTDVQVWTMSWNYQRYEDIQPDLETLVRGIRCVPDPANKPAQHPKGS